MSVKTFLLPDLGEGLTEAELVKWLVAVGDTVVIDQPIAEVETAKSMVEVPSPYAGTVHQLHGAAGEMIQVDTPLISVLEEGAEAPVAPAPEREVALSYREEERAGAVEPKSEGSGNVLIGYGTPEGLSAKARKRRPRAGAVAAAAPSATQSVAPLRAPLVISPLVRKLAKDRGIDIASVRGSGSGGLILRSDVEAAAAPVSQASPAVPAAVAAAPVEVVTVAVSVPAGERDSRSGLTIASRTPITGVRKTIAAAMTRSRSEIPEATVWVDVDATALLEMRSALKAKDQENTPGLLAFIARFVVAGLQK